MNRVVAREALRKIRIDLSYAQLLVIAAIVLACFGAIFALKTATSMWSFPRFVAASLILIYLPGKLLLDMSGVRRSRLDGLALSLVLGMTVSTCLYWVCRLVGVPSIFLLWPLAAIVNWFYRTRWNPRRTEKAVVSVDLSHLLLLVALGLAVTPLVAISMFYRNLALLPGGGMTFLISPDDVNFHLAIIQELTHAVPPQIPFFYGHGLNYHYAMDLLVVMFSATAGLDISDLTVRFLPTLFVTVVVLTVFCFSRVWINSGVAGVVVAVLVIFGEDFSFVPGLWSGSQKIWSAQYFGVPTTYSLYLLNPMLPALAILFGGLYFLREYYIGRSVASLVLTGILFAVLLEWKVFTGAHVLAALGIAGVAYALIFRDYRLLKAATVTALFSLPFLLHIVLSTNSGDVILARVDPQTYLPETIRQLGLANTPVGQFTKALFDDGIVSAGSVIVLLALSLPGYVLGSMGMRVVAIPEMAKGIFVPIAEGGIRYFLIVFSVLGIAVTLVTKVTPVDFPDSYNNSVWFFVQSKYVVWLIAVGGVWALLRRRFWPGLAAITMLVVFSVPSAVQSLGVFAERTYKDMGILSHNHVELISFLDQDCRNGAMVLARQDVALTAVSLARCRVPLVNLNAYSFVRKDEVEERKKDLDGFWLALDIGELQSDILLRYGVNGLVVGTEHKTALRTIVARNGGEGLSARRDPFLQLRYENEEFSVYRVTK